MARLFPALCRFPDRMAVRFGSSGLTYGELAAAATDLSCRIAGARRVAVWATSSPQTVVGVVAALLAGVPAVPLNPKSGEKELGHILADSAPTYLLAAPSVELPGVLKDLSRIDIALGGAPAAAVTEPEDDEAAALIVYTSGTTGPPKGAVLPRRAVAATLDGLAEVWQWTADDVLVHGLPLFHVHGLVLGVLGPLRRGGTVRHLGRFTTEGVADELSSGATMLFGVPTMYHRIAEVLPADPQLAKALTGARLLVSGSAALPLHDHERITAVTGRRVIERYGMTETLMSTSVHPDAPSAPGTVGHHLPGVEVRLVDDAGTALVGDGPDHVGEIQVRGPNLFTEYLNRPDATAEAFTAEGWFRTGDMAVHDNDGSIRIVGRRATDLIKSGGYKIGAGEIENALLEHPAVREAAVTGELDVDLGQRVVAWIVPTDAQAPPSTEELAAHVAERLAPHKRPRVVRVIAAMPRNDMGKIMKRVLHG
ncbi:acyl-CoA synthetase [Streptomyces sp. NBC_01352]|uniref:acyl-CoA synthetase n=1 Tax=Streptomyces sp. NBC_01352 TaxID=2903834 RepID=UPI002E310F91|nr:acyl-CoA synthetase [Streptomyces sp. NBC_01352]